MPDLVLDAESSTPVYRQIVEQVRYLVEGGGLGPGDRLPPVRQLADSLGVNRNTVAKAYSALRELGLIETRGVSGTTIAPRRSRSATADLAGPADAALRDAVREALRQGMTPQQVRDAAFTIALRSASGLRAVFVECNEERAVAFAKELSDRLDADIRPGLLTELDDATADCQLIVTTFFHLAEVRRWAHTSRSSVDTVAVVVAPHVRTLTKVAELPEGARVGVRYSTPHQAEQVRDWLAAAGRVDVVVVPHDRPDVPSDLAMLVVPSEDPALGAGAGPGTEVVAFGNVLDEGSIRMVGEVLDEIRSRPAADRARHAARPHQPDLY